jgi:hypothetical protein
LIPIIVNPTGFNKSKASLSESPFNVSYQVINSSTSKVLIYSMFDYTTKKDHMYNRTEMNEILYKNDISVEFANAVIEMVGVEVLKNLFYSSDIILSQMYTQFTINLTGKSIYTE